VYNIKKHPYINLIKHIVRMRRRTRKVKVLILLFLQRPGPLK